MRDSGLCASRRRTVVQKMFHGIPSQNGCFPISLFSCHQLEHMCIDPGTREIDAAEQNGLGQELLDQLSSYSAVRYRHMGRMRARISTVAAGTAGRDRGGPSNATAIYP